MQNYGMTLAGEVLKIIGALQSPETPIMKPILTSMSDTLQLPARYLPDVNPIKNAHKQALKSLEDAETDDEKYNALQMIRKYGESLDFIENATEFVSAEIQIMRIGDLVLVATPGEMFVQLGLEIKHKSVAPNTFVVELANGWIGYLLNKGGFAEGGYESQPGPWTKVNEKAGQMLVDRALEMIDFMWL